MAAWLLPSSFDVVMVSAYLASLTAGVRNPDIFWHIRTGEIVATERLIPRENLFSFTAPDYPWIDTEWLAQVCLYGVSDLLGPHWLLLLRGVCFAAAMGLLYRLLRRKGGVLPSLVLAMMALVVALPFLLVGPSMVALPFFMLELTLLEDLDWRRQSSMFLLPVLFLVWANLHGSFFIGLMLLMLHIIGAIWDWRKGRGDSIWFYHLMGLMPAVLFSLWNPYYSGIYLQGLGKLWQAVLSFPFLLTRPASALAFLAVAVFTIVTSYLVRHTMPRRMLLPLLGLGLFLVFHREAMAEAVMLAVIAIMQNLQTLAYSVRHEAEGSWAERRGLRQRLQRVGERLKAVSAFDRRLSGRTYIILTASLTVALFTLDAERPVQVAGVTLRGISLEEVITPSIAPTEAVEWLQGTAFPDARVLVPMEAAGYVVYKGWPQLRVFMDSRTRAYPPEVLQDYQRFATASPGWEEVLETWEVDFILWYPFAFQPRALVTEGHWRLLHADPYMVLLGRADEEDGPSVSPSWWQLVGAMGDGQGAAAAAEILPPAAPPAEAPAAPPVEEPPNPAE